MGMSGYIMDIQEQFEDKCFQIAKESECYQEYCERAVLNDGMVPFLDEEEIADIIGYVWQEVWSKYQ